MTAKNPTKDGITKRGESTWLVRVFMGRDANGKVRYHSKTIHGTRKDAIRYRNKVRTEHDVGAFIQPSRQSVADYLRKWLETSAKQRVSEKTLEDYSSHVERYLIPALGALRLSELRPPEIQKLYADMSERLSPRTVRYVHSTLRSALEQSVRWGELARNPSTLVDLPQQKRREMRVLDSEQVGRLLAAAEGTRFHALWLLLVTTGLRPGEALGLKWNDLTNGKLHVQRTLVRCAGGWSLEEPKTDRSRRVVPLPPTAVRSLAQHRRSQLEERMLAGISYSDLDLMFASKTGEPLEFRVVARRYFKPLLRLAELPDIRPYDLRHTHATLLLKGAEHPKVVSERLGHSSTVMTMDVYSHVLPDMQQSAAEKVEELLFRGAVAR